MNWVDLVIVAAIAWATFRGFQTGMVRQLTTLLALVAGLALAATFYDDLSTKLDFLVEDERTRNFSAFMAILIGMMVAGQVAGSMLSGVAAVLFLGPLDHVAGAVIGFVQGVLTAQAFLVVIAVFPAATGAAKGVDDSRLADLFLDKTPSITQFLPEQFKEPLRQLEDWRALGESVAPRVPAPAPGR